MFYRQKQYHIHNIGRGVYDVIYYFAVQWNFKKALSKVLFIIKNEIRVFVFMMNKTLLKAFLKYNYFIIERWYHMYLTQNTTGHKTIQDFTLIFLFYNPITGLLYMTCNLTLTLRDGIEGIQQVTKRWFTIFGGGLTSPQWSLII